MRRVSRAQQQQIALMASAVVVLGVIVSVVVAPLWRKAAGLGGDIRTAQDKLKLLERVTANEAVVQTQLEELSQTVQSLRTLLPGESELPAIIALLSDLASQSSVKIQSIFPQRPIGSPQAKGGKGPAKDAANVYTEIPIQIDAAGGYHQLGTFLSLMESSKKLLGLSSLKITGNPQDPKRHTFKLVVMSYVAVDEAKAPPGGKPRS